MDVVEDESGVEEHDGSELAGLSIDVFDLLVVLFDAEHQLEVVLADIVQDCFIQPLIMIQILVLCNCFQRL